MGRRRALVSTRAGLHRDRGRGARRRRPGPSDPVAACSRGPGDGRACVDSQHSRVAPPPSRPLRPTWPLRSDISPRRRVARGEVHAQCAWDLPLLGGDGRSHARVQACPRQPARRSHRRGSAWHARARSHLRPRTGRVQHAGSGSRRHQRPQLAAHPAPDLCRRRHRAMACGESDQRRPRDASPWLLLPSGQHWRRRTRHALQRYGSAVGCHRADAPWARDIHDVDSRTAWQLAVPLPHARPHDGRP